VIHTDKSFSSRVESTVAALEKTTDVEIIVVAAERSGHYRDIAMGAASVGALVFLAIAVVLPWGVHSLLLLVDVLVVWCLLAWLFNGRWALSMLVPEARKAKQVREIAECEFHREAVHATPNRTGLLIYVSALEERVELLPDVALEGSIPPGAWTTALQEFSHSDVDHFVAGLNAMGALLSKHVPALDVDPIDLPNAPRIRS